MHMVEKTASLPIKNVQVKLTEEEYNMLWDLAAKHRLKITPFARDLFVRAIKSEAGVGQKLRSIGKPSS